MLMLLLTYAYTLPGTPLWADWGAFSPTREGLAGGGVRVLRLALMLIALAVLLTGTPRACLIYGLYVLARPFSVLGLDRRAFAVRLGLTLEYIEQQDPHGRASLSQWLASLQQPLAPDNGAGVYRLQSQRWKWYDSFAMLGVLAAVLLSASV